MEAIRVWESGSFRLEIGDVSKVHGDRAYYEYVLYFKGEEIFYGMDYGPSPMHDPHGDAAVADLLHFLSIMEGDVEDSYFDNYTDKQMAFVCSEDCEELRILAMELEE